MTGRLRIYPLNLIWIIPAKGVIMHQKNLPVFFFILFILILTGANAFGEEHLIFGKLVSETTGQPVESANILLEDGSGTFSDKDGNFRIKTSFLPIKVTVTHIAFRDTSFSANSEDCGTIYLKPTVITGEYVFVTATRAVKAASCHGLQACVTLWVSIAVPGGWRRPAYQRWGGTRSPPSPDSPAHPLG